MQLNPVNVPGGAAAPATADPKKRAEDTKLRAVCKDMESVFLNMLLTQMRRTVPKDGILGQSSQQDIMQSLLDSEMSKNMAQAGGIGLADMLYRQLSPTLAPNITSNKGQAPK